MNRFQTRYVAGRLCLAVLLGFGWRAEAATLTVSAGGNLQAALDKAEPGDTILLQAGATFVGNFTLPAKRGTTYITIRSATPDSLLPPSGTRMTPAYAPLLARIRSDSRSDPDLPAIRTNPGASYWRLRFLEFAPGTASGTRPTAANLVELGDDGPPQTTLSSVPHHLVIDRCYLHGDRTYGQRRGVVLNSGNAKISNSYFANFKDRLVDTQAVAGWNGPGPFLIENNYLEAAGENVLFGGGDPSILNLVPSDITIRRNLISKPPAWRTQSWVVKNLIEFKNAQRVLVEGNTIENNWAAAQSGYSILLTPRNQGHTAPWTVVKHVVIQNNVIRHVAAVFNILGYDNLAASQQTRDITIRNNLAYDISVAYHTATAADGRLAIIGAGPRDIRFDHNTADNDGAATVLIYGGKSPTGTRIAGFTLTNNLLRDNKYGLYGDKVGEGTAGLSTYTTHPTVLHNTFAGASAKLYPTGNDFPTLTQWLADFVNRSVHDYRLVSGSLSNNAATDGRDIGVGFGELNAARKATSSPVPILPQGEPTPFTAAPIPQP